MSLADRGLWSRIHTSLNTTLTGALEERVPDQSAPTLINFSAVDYQRVKHSESTLLWEASEDSAIPEFTTKRSKWFPSRPGRRDVYPKSRIRTVHASPLAPPNAFGLPEFLLKRVS